jgi:phage gpG-like protein
MGEFNIQLKSNAQERLREIRGFSNTVFNSLRTALDEENQMTVRHIAETKLSQRGPNTLGVVSNRLRGSLRATAVRVSGTALDSAIGTNVEYAGVHEYGFTGQVVVRAHRRKVRSRDVRRKRKVVAKGVAFVGSFVRWMSVPERAPIRTGIQERSEAYSEALGKAIERTPW